MALLKIARMGNPALRVPASPVEDPASPDIAQLIADMLETMEDAGGIGLAAPQVHVRRRLVVFNVPRHRAGQPDAPAGSLDGPVPLTVLINPEIEPLGEDKVEDWESCLSLPGFAGWVPRYRRIRYRATTPDGGSLERLAEGFHARVVQHECDHLDGMLYPLRMTDLSRFGFAEEIRRSLQAAGGESGGRDA